MGAGSEPPARPDTKQAPEPKQPPEPDSPAARKADGPPSSSSSPSPSEPRATEQGTESADPPYTHEHFSNNERMRQMQPVLELVERRKAFEGLTDVGPGSWAYLYDNPPARLLTAVVRPLRNAARSLLLPGVLSRLQSVSERMIREEVESSFDAHEFLDGVREAVPAWYGALAAREQASLRAMASSKALEAAEAGRRKLAEEGLEVASVAATVETAAISGVNLWGPDSVRAFDAGWLEELSAGGTKSWLVVSVTLDVRLDVVYRAVGGGQPGAGGEAGAGGEGSKGGTGGKGAAEASGVVRRFGSWLLARGPLPRGASSSLDSSWRVLAWW